MTIDELISILEDARDEHGGDTEVRYASWPFEWSMGSNTATARAGNEELQEFLEEKADPDNEWTDDEKEMAHEEQTRLEEALGPVIFYLSEGSQLGYLPGDVKSELGW